jgi:hypothetical protein
MDTYGLARREEGLWLREVHGGTSYFGLCASIVDLPLNNYDPYHGLVSSTRSLLRVPRLNTRSSHYSKIARLVALRRCS